MRNFQDTFETRKRCSITAFLIFMTTFKQLSGLRPDPSCICENVYKGTDHDQV